MEETLLKIASKINEYLGNYILVFSLVAIGLFYSIKTKFVQVRCFGQAFKNITNKNKQIKDGLGLSSFQALATAVAAQVGTGNIVGASGAILIGGPGAIFWMWVIAFFGMATIYAEATLAQKTRVVDADGTVKGGPVFYIREAFKGKFGRGLAIFFSFAAIISLGFFGAMVQSNAIGANMNKAFSIPTWAMGLILVAFCSVLFFSGIKKLASFLEKLVVIMACLFIVGAVVVLCFRIQYIPETFALIFKYAFMPQAIIGGGFGVAIKTAISQGAKRGLFSNEAGMGSTPHAHALAEVESPHDQGICAMTGVFIDTFIVLTLNALVIISTLYAGDGILSGGVIPENITKNNLAQLAFSSVFGETFGNIFVAVCLFFFAISTILSWNLFGKINAVDLFGKKNPKLAMIIYSSIALVFVFLGTMISNDLVWELQDMTNQLMVIPNVLALFVLSKLVVGMTKKKDGSLLNEI